MAQNTDLNVSPYYDDYDETKDYHRILFRPSNAIQARELTQLQSILQNQVEKFGNHIFEEGSLVMGGTTTVNTLYYAVKVNTTNPNASGTQTTETYRTAAIGKYYQGKDTGVVAKVINSTAATTDADPLTLFVTYVKTGNPSGTTYYDVFNDNEDIEECTVNAAGEYSTSGNSNNEFRTINPAVVEGHSSATSTGSAVTIRGGILYTRGFFVRCDEQTILLDKYSNTPTYRIGLQITESLFSSTDDTSLLDNATGASNENAPGANRLKIQLTLVKKAIGGTQDIDNFIELSRVEAGIVTKQVKVTAYASLERTLARRTYDESGDYVIKPFHLELREHLNNKINGGVYLSTNTVTPGDNDLMVGIFSPGKAYVKGFEIDKPSQSLIEISKSRSSEDAGALAVPFEIGNYFNVTNIHGQPEWGNQSASIAPYGFIDLYDTANTTAGAANGTKIGVARCRFFNYTSGDHASNIHSGLTTNFFKLHLFDIRMYTKLTVAATAYRMTAGQRVKGSVSGAKGILAADSASGATTLYILDVEGTFSTSDTIRLEQATSAGKAVSAVKSYSTDDVRQTYQATRTTGADFTADTVLTDNQFPISGTIKANGTALTGVNTKFTQELKVGDTVVAPSGEAEKVTAVTSDTVAVIVSIGTASEGKFIRQRARLLSPEQTVAISPTPKNFVKSVTPNQVTLRQQTLLTFAGDTAGLGAVGGSNSLIAEDNNDYLISVHENGSTDNSTDGQTINIAQSATTLAVTTTSNGTFTVTHAQAAALDADDLIKATYGIQKDVSSAAATKTLNRSRGVMVSTVANATATSSASNDVYGTNINDEIITLGVPDVYAVRAVYESTGLNTLGTPSDNALPPRLTVASGFAGNPGDKISGDVSGAIGKIIQVSGTTVYFYYVTEVEFTTSDTVTNSTSSDDTSNSRAVSAVTVDSKDITNSFYVDDGQRDGYYGLASIKRAPGSPVPSGRLLIIFDYFTSGSGNFFNVNSYSTVEWENIPNYIPNITDPGGLEPDGIIELADAIDYRSYCGRLHDPSAVLQPAGTVTNVSDIALQPLLHGNELFYTSGLANGVSVSGVAAPVVFDLPKSGQSLTTTAMTHYLPRIDKLVLSSEGEFLLSEGQPADHPVAPTTPANSILLHTLYIPAYTADLTRVSTQSQDHKRFTMRDIGRIQGRVKNLERVTSLNALEQETNLHQIQDADGLDRFKSGFVTDNFRGHRTGDTNHPDYKVAVDRTTGTLRPQHNSKFVDISLTTGSSSGYTKTGDLITLPFTEETFVNIDKASTTEFVNPYDVVLFNGTVSLNPTRDMWFDTERLPAVRRTVEGDYDAILSGVGNALGTVWNNWQDDWIGTPVTTIEEPPQVIAHETPTTPTPRVIRKTVTPRTRKKTFPGRSNRGGGGGGRQWNTIRFELR